MSAERRGPAICNVSNIRAGEDGMIKTSDDSQDLRGRICVKAKAELLRRFWSIRSYAQERQGLGWERWIRQSRKSPQQDRSHKPRREANGGAQCGKSACCVRCGGGWRRGLVERHLGQSRRASPRPYRRGGSWKRGVAEMCWPNRRASSRPYRCGGGWRRGLVERHLGHSRRASPRPYRRGGDWRRGTASAKPARQSSALAHGERAMKQAFAS